MTVTAVIIPVPAGARRKREREALLLAGAVEDGSEHPIGQAIARAAAARFGGLPKVTGFTALPGAGVRGRVGDRDVTVGSPGLFAELLIEVPAALRDAVDAAADDGRTAVLVGWDGQARAALTVADELRPGAAAAVARLRALGLRPVLLTGDNERVAAAVAGQVGIAERRRARRRASRWQGRGHQAAAGRRAAGRVRRRRDQRRRRPRAGRPRHGGRHRHRRGHRRRRPHPGRRPPGRDRRRHRARPRHDDRDQGQPRLGVLLQRDRHPAGGAGLPQPAVRRDRHVRQLTDRRGEQPAPAPLHPRQAPAAPPARMAPTPRGAPGGRRPPTIRRPPGRGAPWPRLARRACSARRPGR